MSSVDRRGFLRLAGASASVALLPQCIRTALAIPAATRTGTIADVEHVVILMQENRSFDHYFGTMAGVRGFGDRLPIPLPSGKPVWHQQDRTLNEVLPYRLDETQGNAQRVSGTPHGWEDGHFAWNDGRTGLWPVFKEPQSMGHYSEQELPFQFALANAFTLCDAYHCSVLSSTNPNRLFLFTGTNDPLAAGGGPAIDNSNDDLGPPGSGFTWKTYAERLEAAGVSWKVYQDMDDNFTDNSLEGFQSFRDAYAQDPSSPLVRKGLSSTLQDASLDGLKADVLSGQLPQVSYIVGPAAYSEHTGPSSPVQGGWYIQQVIEALTADPGVWARTALFVMFDENDGFFDHVPPPCAPSREIDGSLAGASTVDDRTERHALGHRVYDRDWVYGPGMRVPMYVVSPWSRGGWVNSQVFDHTSILRFLEARFGVIEPNISAWRRAVCGDLTSCFNFATPNDESLPALPRLSRAEADALRASQEQLEQIPAPRGSAATLPRQQPGVRPSRALPYELHVNARHSPGELDIVLDFANTGGQGAVFHVYDRKHLLRIPRRYTVEAGKQLAARWSTLLDAGAYDLWVLGPNGFHRHFAGTIASLPSAALPEVRACYDVSNGQLYLKVRNDGASATTLTVAANAYRDDGPWQLHLEPSQETELRWPLRASGFWYDFTVTAEDGFLRRLAGRIETGAPSVSDPAMGLG